jgi:hypothetical protein
MEGPDPMHIHIVLASQNAGWVIGKMGHRLAHNLRALGHTVQVSDAPDPTADINHWMSFAFADGCAQTLNTMFVTHADDPFKVGLIRERLSGPIQLALCMSPHAAEELSGFGVPRERLWHVLPAIDTPLAPRRVVIGITTRVYDDGRKREKFLLRLARDMRLDAFRFQIFGIGWEAIVPELRKAGAEVEVDAGTEDWQGDYARMQAAIPGFNYYLYTGMDEGSLGTLDAASASVKTIVTAQGFHMSIPGGIDHPFVSYEEMRDVFHGIAARRAARTAAYGEWSWANYAREHAAVWQAMLEHRSATVPRETLEAATRRESAAALAGTPSQQGTIAERNLRFYLRSLEPMRIRGGIARLRWLQPLRKALKF